MKTKFFLGVAALVLAALPLRATVVDLTGFGPQPGNSGQGTIEAWMASLVAAYNTPTPTLPVPVGSELFRQNTNGESGSFGLPIGFPTFPSGTLSIVIPVGYDYIALHWGGQGGGSYEAYYVGGTGNTFNAPGQNGLSWYDGFRPHSSKTPGVPDSGSTLVLFGLALCGLASLRRLFAR